jgi:hypothetical protein
MTATSDVNHPAGSHPGDGEASEMVLLTPRRPKVRGLQRKLWAAAKRSPNRRFHALYDRIWRGDFLQEAWKRVRSNKGAAGIDGRTLAAVEEYGAERLLAELQRDLREGTYRPAAARRVEGQLLSQRELCRQVQPDRQLRLAQALWPDAKALWPQPPSGPVGDLGEQLVLGPGPSSPTRNDSLSGGRVAMPRRSSVSRVRENRTHGLKGEWGNRPAWVLRP